MVWRIVTITTFFLLNGITQATEVPQLTPNERLYTDHTPKEHWQQEERAKIFKDRPTDEAGAKLAAMNKFHEERIFYQLDTQVDALNYEKETKELARWYLRALLRSHIGSLVHGTRQNLRDERNRNRSHEKAMRENALERAVGRGRALASAPDMQVDYYIRPLEERESGGLGKVLNRIVEIAEMLTHDGVRVSLPTAEALFRLDTRTTMMMATLDTKLIGLTVSYRVRDAGKPLPFSGASAAFGQERLVIGGSKYFDETGTNASVSYYHKTRQVDAGVDQEIAGPLVAHVAKSWNLEGGFHSSAGLTLSMMF